MMANLGSDPVTAFIGLMRRLSEPWTAPFEDKFDSLFRGYEHTTISHLAEVTLKAARIAMGER